MRRMIPANSAALNASLFSRARVTPCRSSCRQNLPDCGLGRGQLFRPAQAPGQDRAQNPRANPMSDRDVPRQMLRIEASRAGFERSARGQRLLRATGPVPDPAIREAGDYRRSAPRQRSLRRPFPAAQWHRAAAAGAGIPARRSTTARSRMRFRAAWEKLPPQSSGMFLSMVRVCGTTRPHYLSLRWRVRPHRSPRGPADYRDQVSFRRTFRTDLRAKWCAASPE